MVAATVAVGAELQELSGRETRLVVLGRLVQVLGLDDNGEGFGDVFRRLRGYRYWVLGIGYLSPIRTS